MKQGYDFRKPARTCGRVLVSEPTGCDTDADQGTCFVTSRDDWRASDRVISYLSVQRLLDGGLMNQRARALLGVAAFALTCLQTCRSG